MPDDAYSFSQTRVRLEEIVTQVRKKDVSLEKSLDLLEEGVRLANQCTELIDHADWGTEMPTREGAADSAREEIVVMEGSEASAEEPAAPSGDDPEAVAEDGVSASRDDSAGEG